MSTEARHRAAERWLSNVLQQCIDRLDSGTLSQAEIIKAVHEEVCLAEPWLQEILPFDRLVRALQIHLNITVARPINKISFTFEVGED